MDFIRFMQVYRVDTAIPPNPRWVKNVSNEPVELTYNSQTYTLKPEEVLYTDLGVAIIFEQQSIVYKIDERNGFPRAVGNKLKVYDKEPTIDGGLDARVSTTTASKQAVEVAAPKEATIMPVTAETPMPQVRSTATQMGIKWAITAKKADILALIQKKLAE